MEIGHINKNLDLLKDDCNQQIQTLLTNIEKTES